MVSYSSLLLAFSAIAGSLAAPAESIVKDDIAKRGPSNFVINATNATSSLARRSAINYNQDYTTGGTVNYYHSSTGFQVNWSTQNDFVVGIGWSPGSTTSINFGGQFSVSSGTGLLSVYGWSTNPLVEYYIIEDYANPPSFGTQKGTVYSDGSNYVIWENTRYNEPSIEGTSTFNQYISVRQSPRTEGTITVQNHFNAWGKLGMNLGSLNYQVVAVEGWGGSGSASYAVNNN
ncbi:endo-1,4-beta-xylanase (XlnA), putative [Talaromyces stipitatus ATCC 10500]|uniref:Endo-1,4-beta-xylanase n=1 Tax=Talaromyces stipitatus (strain ATCC 10500 / CBS 375.48 / QM 6759 / NRRL 1006) TaxID=441959 RepID=B8MTU7_TALSN|nr:endo-1,4-beta-xylanase (XlnA), putative [Talaromyces stipitatus ATCC 10500]EED12490.1 endo-1,4-beta-xylanase (XlnA), putative [Talaromyces stipitatus ATCC 10500]